MGQMDTLAIFNDVNRDYYSLKKWVSTIQNSDAEFSAEIYKRGCSYPEMLYKEYTRKGLGFYDVKDEIMRRCKVSPATAESWLENQPDPRNRVEAKLRVVETAIVLNLSLKDVNKLLTHYLQLPELDPKKAEDALCIYLIEKQIVLPYGSEKWKINNKVNYSNRSESEEIELKKWERILAKSTAIKGDWAKDTAEVAKSQMGYKANQGFTCYGAWFAGSSECKYDDWSAIFAAWCLNWVGVNDSVFTPIYTKFYSSNSFSVKDWANGLKDFRLFLDVHSNYMPKIGDLVFLDLDKNGIEDHVGIITEVDKKASAVVGDVIAGDEHVVKLVSFDISDSSVVGYATTPYPKTLIDVYNQLSHIRPKVVALSGDWAKDIAEVAKSQVGYKANQGFTCYGAWFAGSSECKYDDWSAIFAAWCLNWVGVNDSVFTPLYTKFSSTGSFRAEDWAKGLKDFRLFLDVHSNYMPKIGDLVFLDLDKNGIEDHVGIITEVDKKASAVVGDVQVGDEHIVKLVSFDISDSSVVGYATTPTPLKTNSSEVNTNNNQEYFSTLAFRKIVSKEVPSYIELNSFLTQYNFYLRDKADKLIEKLENEWLSASSFYGFLMKQGQWDSTRLANQWYALRAKRAMISRERTILMCIKLRMPVSKINECLETAGFMKLYPKDPLEGALIVILNGLLATSSCMMNANSNNRFFLFGTSSCDGDVSNCISNMRSQSGLFCDISIAAANWGRDKKSPVFRDEQFKAEGCFTADFWLSIEKFITSVTNGEADAALKYMPDAYRLMCWLADPRNQDGNKTYIRKMIGICMRWYIEKRQKQGFSLPEWLEEPKMKT